MLFNSYIFIFVFLPVTLAGFLLIGRRGGRRIALAWLVLCSLLFYAWWNPAYLGLLLFSILFNYGVGVYLGSKEGSRRNQKLVLAAGVAANLILLGYFKYANFFVDTVSALTGSDYSFGAIMLPLGISFFTFQQIAYLVDAYKGLAREYNFLSYCLFVTFFPQLIAGPIVHHQEMLPQFARLSNYRVRKDNLSIGATIFIIGLFKKVMVADSLALYANVVFDGAARGISPSFAEAWLGAMCYTFQLYFDFSGYSDMAIGLGRMFGIRLPLNFNSPYKANSVIDFWRRWHMTLSRFLRDYLYIPLGGNRKGTTRRYANVMVTMVLGGLWHGAGWTFVLWGTMHGVFLLVNHAWRGITGVLGLRTIGRSLPALVAARTITFLSVSLAWVLFRAANFHAAGTVLASMAGVNGLTLATPYFDAAGLQARDADMWVLVLIFICGWAPSTQQLLARYRPALGYVARKGRIAFDNSLEPKIRWKPTPLMALVVAVVAIVTIVNLTKVSAFIYWQF